MSSFFLLSIAMMGSAALYLLLLHVAFLNLASPSLTNTSGKIPIVFVYTVVPAVCSKGLPMYIRVSLEQAIFSQPEAEVIMVSNYADCPKIEDTVANITNLTTVDCTKLASDRTQSFINISTSLFSSDHSNELWTQAAIRFLRIEDLMIAKGKPRE